MGGGGSNQICSHEKGSLEGFFRTFDLIGRQYRKRQVSWVWANHKR